MPRSASAVKLDRVAKTYAGGEHAVVGVSLDVEPGELMVLVGPSGSGKTTLLRLIAGLETPTAGTITIGGRDVARLRPRDRRVSMVFQDAALYQHLTVGRNIGLALGGHGGSRIDVDRRVREAAETTGVADLLDRRPDTLSGGQQQRVALARAIVAGPECMLLDEPLSNLDGSARLQLRGDIRHAHECLGTTTIYVTHDHEEAMALGDRMAVLASGRLEQVDVPLTVYRRPESRDVAELVGSPPMNLIQGRLEPADDGVTFDDGRGVRLPAPGVRSMNGAAVVLGVRPSDLRVCHADADGVTLTIERCEPLGAVTDLVGRSEGGTPVRVRLDTRDAPSRGDRVRVMASPGAIHLFAADTGGRRLAT